MKYGTISRSTTQPESGFKFTRQGYEIYISYIDPDTIKEIEINDSEQKRTEYEYVQYSYYGPIMSYEELVNKSILLKYSIEKELSLMAKAIIDIQNPEYLVYREYVNLCKQECSNNYLELGLIKEKIEL